MTTIFIGIDLAWQSDKGGEVDLCRVRAAGGLAERLSAALGVTVKHDNLPVRIADVAATLGQQLTE